MSATGPREWAIRFAATLFEECLELGASVEMVLAGRSIPPLAGADRRTRVLDALARLPEEGHPPLAELVQGSPARAQRVVITSDDSAELLRGNGAIDSKLRVITPGEVPASPGTGGSVRRDVGLDATRIVCAVD